MIVKVFESNSHGKIEFTRNELEKLLNEVYKKGYDSGVMDTKHNVWTWTSPTLSSPTYRYDTTINSTNCTPIDNLKSDTSVATNSVDTNRTIKASDVLTDAFNSIGLQMKNTDPVEINFSKSIDDIVNAIFNDATTSTIKANSETAHDKLAKELKNL